jgi:hypothetical protein
MRNLLKRIILEERKCGGHPCIRDKQKLVRDIPELLINNERGQTPFSSKKTQILQTVIHIKLNRMGSHTYTGNIFHLQFNICIEQVISKHATS